MYNELKRVDPRLVRAYKGVKDLRYKGSESKSLIEQADVIKRRSQVDQLSAEYEPLIGA